MYSALIGCSPSPTREGAAQGRLAVRLQQHVQSLDVLNPALRPAMRELGEIGERHGFQIDHVLSLQVKRSRSGRFSRRKASAPVHPQAKSS